MSSILKKLKDSDADRYLLSLFIEDECRREAVAALDVLNYELSRLKDTVQTPPMGIIRLKWWADEVAKLYAGSVPGTHEIFPVLETVKTVLSEKDYTTLIEARAADFDEYDKDFDIYDYAVSVHAPLTAMKAKILGEEADSVPLAEAYALVGLMRAVPFYKARSQVLLPDINPESVRAVCEEAERLLSLDETTHRYFKAHRVLAKLYLKQLKKAGYRPDVLQPLPFKELRLWLGTLTA